LKATVSPTNDVSRQSADLPASAAWPVNDDKLTASFCNKTFAIFAEFTVRACEWFAEFART